MAGWQTQDMKAKTIKAHALGVHEVACGASHDLLNDDQPACRRCGAQA